MGATMKRHLVIPLTVAAGIFGGTLTPVFADTQPTPAAIASGPIAPGDTLWKLAKSHGVPLALLESVNPNLDPENLLVGQIVKIPRVWLVSKGDTLFVIAHTFGVSVESIAQLNNIEQPDVIYPGQQLLIPEQMSSNTVSVYPRWTVRKGDTLWTISQTTGVAVSQIVTLNAVQVDNLPIGRVLLIPPTAKSWTQPPEQVQPLVNQSGNSTQGTTLPATVAKIELTMPVSSLPANSTENFEVDVTALDSAGNPVPNVTLDIVGSPWAHEIQVVTDDQGKAMFTVEPGFQAGNLRVGVQDPISNISTYISYTVTAGGPN